MEKIDYLQIELKKIQAVETLEYLDKNLLSGNNESRSRERQEQIRYCIKLTREIKENKK